MTNDEITMVQGIENAPAAAKLREEVFLQEQGFSTEFDEIDPIAWHLTLTRGGETLAVGRLYPAPVAKPWRGQSLGRDVALALEQKARLLGGRAIDLSAQLHAQGFYEKLGYAAYGDIYLDEHCPHIHMKKQL